MMKKNSREDGMVIVEATIVFPVMFLVIFLMIFLGNAYFQKARVESIVNELALDGAAYCADSMLKTIEETKAVPALDAVDVKPYRYFIGGMDTVETDIKNEAVRRISGLSTGLFSGMKPEGYNTGDLKVQFHNKFISSSFSIDLQYKIVMPIRLLWESDYLELRLSSHTELPVSDTTEFMRNVNMVEDYMERYGIVDEIKKMVSKVREWFQ